MVWIKDQFETMVNIDKWNFLNYQSISDSETGKVVAYKIYLEGNSFSMSEEYILGYADFSLEIEDIIAWIPRGINIHLYELDQVIWHEFVRNRDQKFLEMGYEESKKYIEKFIGKRFKEDI